MSFPPSSSDKKPAGVAIVIGADKPDMPGATIPKDSFGDKFDSLKEGDTGTMMVKFKVASKSGDSVDLDFESIDKVSCKGDGMDSESEESMMDEEDGDSMEDRFEKFSSKE